MNIQKVSIIEIKPAKYNPRKDLKPGDLEYEKLKRSIEEFGFVEPLVWNKRTGNLVSGHQRYKVLRSKKIQEIEVSVVDLDENKEKALNIALNKIKGDWDEIKLKDLLFELEEAKFDVTLTGYEENELEKLLPTPIKDIDELLQEIDMSKAIQTPVWVTIRADKSKLGIIEQALRELTENDIRVERSYEHEG